jgi:hypothetical protein
MDNEVKVKKKGISLLLTEAHGATPAKRGRLEEKVMIKVESLLRDEHMMEANELVELMTETVEARLAMIAASKTPPAASKKAICSIIFASTTLQPTCEELIACARQFEIKWGSDFIRAAIANDLGCADERIVHKLGVEPPSKTRVIECMRAIAEEYHSAWTYGGDDDVDGASMTPAPPGSVPPVIASGGGGGGGGGGFGGGGGGGFGGFDEVPIASAVVEPTFGPVVVKPYVDPTDPANGKFPGGVPAASFARATVGPAASAAPAIYGQPVPVVDATFDLPPAAPSGFPPAAPSGFPPAAPSGFPPAAPSGFPPAAPTGADADAMLSPKSAAIALPAAPSGFDLPAAPTTPAGGDGDTGLPDYLRPFAAATPPVAPAAAAPAAAALPPAAPAAAAGDDGVPDYDDLAARFAALRS